MWSQILLLLTIPVAIYFLFTRIENAHYDVKVNGLITLFLLFSNELLPLLNEEFYITISGYLVMGIHVFILIVLLDVIHWLRPEFSRYPYPFVYIPLIILLSYPFIEGTEVLINIILTIIQGGSLFVLGTLYIGHYSSFKRKWIALLSIFTFLAAFSIFWFLPGNIEISKWMWQPLIVVGMISSAYTLAYLLLDNQP